MTIGGGQQLPDGWMSTSLESVLTGPRELTYGIVQPGEYVPGGIPIVRVTDIRNGRVAVESPMRVSEAVAAPFGRSRLQGGELLITLVGTVGECAVAPAALRGWNTARAVGVVRIRPDVGADWVALCLRSRDVQERIAARVNTTVQMTLNLKDLRDLPIVLPPAAELHRTASFLAALDEKIESNRHVLATAEELADALFLAAADGGTHLAEVARVTMGSSPPGSSYNEDGVGLPFYQGVRDFGGRAPSRRIWTDSPMRLAEKNDTLISVRAPVGRLNRATENCCIGRGVAAAAGRTPSTLYYALRQAADLWSAYQSEGTVFGAIGKTDLAAVRVAWPSHVDLLGVLESRLAALDGTIDSCVRESARLEELRDALLPELLSGRIRVSEAVKT